VHSSDNRVHRHRRDRSAFVVDSADDGGFGRDLDGRGEKGGTKDRSADGGLVEDEVPGEEAGVQIGLDRQRPAQGHAQGIIADREESPYRVRDLLHEHPLSSCHRD
jgi:hypothetical protein